MQNLSQTKEIQIAIFGLGFVGLTTAVGFASKGFKTIGYEIDTKKAKSLTCAKIPFFEEGLESSLKSVLGKNLFITNNLKEALKGSDVIFYCIGTPMSKNGSADLSYLCDAISQTLSHLHLCAPTPTLLIKSTIPPASSKEIIIPLIESFNLKVNNGTESHLFLANNPEFLREGFALDDFLHPDRILIGIENLPDTQILESIYKPFCAPIIFSNLNTAEFIKYLSNTTLSMCISYANEMSLIAQYIGDIDIIQAFNTLHKDKRFSGNPAKISQYIYQGLGFGGYCLPKDTLALYKKSSDKGFSPQILKSILDTNEKILEFYIQKITHENPKHSTIGILGLSFKPKSDDVRDSKSAMLIQRLLENGFSNIYAYDPIATHTFAQAYNLPIKYAQNLKEITQTCDILAIATGWQEFIPLLHNNHKKIYNLRWLQSLDKNTTLDKEPKN